MDKTTLSSPWMTYYHSLCALFEKDNDIRVFFVKDPQEVKIYVNDNDKADALSKILPEKMTFGNIEMPITVVPCNKAERKISLFERAFRGNPAMKRTETIRDRTDYVVFSKEVVQFYNDEIADINGNRSTLYQDLASYIFQDAGVFFCTDTEENP